ncbi:hypothetical protein [Candidatus Galacturonibacter soehngenii]|uniref:Uncharacterized protein n=1 Tax=Candidatus Galacturonatibacter soehngenii TaxID=2307010 RepID=A0A7V7QMD7_9FIRM|nr:hypothetical protein [Candidatus Galacturonibacter soehngenii]KAB1439796.1 hypothetical protein F7O84_05270 [Candidatus Galacturonibacter soehngenii]MBA4685966.1 hypothetical protein [Candidatus Galacturonibacter soehngenii]
MAWCPKCRNEYVNGITFCKDCSETLVDSLEEYDKILMEEKATLEPQIIAGEIPGFEEEAEDKNYEEITSKLTKVSTVYVKKEDKYKDTLSSAYTLLIVGFGGLAVLLLVITDIINLNLASPGKYVTYSGMAILLFVFIIIGFNSLKSSKRLAKEAESENQLTEDIFNWFDKNISLDLIDNGITDDMQEEVKYFKRIDNIKEIIQKAYGELNENYLDKIADDIFQEKIHS